MRRAFYAGFYSALGSTLEASVECGDNDDVGATKLEQLWEESRAFARAVGRRPCVRHLQAERLFRIHELIEARRVIGLDDLVRELEVSRATMKRDLAFLRDRMLAPLVFDRDAGGYRYERSAPGPRFERLRPRYVELVAALRGVVTVMERCEPKVPEVERATDEEWIAALAQARATLRTAVR